MCISLSILLSWQPSGSLAAESKTVELRALSAFPKNHSSVRYLGIFADLVKEKSQGKLIIKWMGGPEATKMFEQPKALQMGAIDLLLTAPAFYQSLLPSAYAFDQSKFSPWEEREKGVYDFWVEQHKKMNAYYLGMLYTGPGFHLYTKTVRVKDPKTGFKGLKIRVSPAYTEIVNALGGVPVMIRTGEIYGALSRGVVDGTGQANTTFYKLQLFELCKYWYEPAFYRTSLTTTVNLKKWNSLSNNLQKILKDAVKELEPKQNQYFLKEDKDFKKKLKENGMEGVNFSPEGAKWYYNIAYESKWNKAKEKMSSEDFSAVYKMLAK
jgi:TRAP-type C4-dicarboxylate transport system substrate-binding protein